MDFVAPRFDIEIRDKKGAKNFVADHLSRIVQDKELFPLHELFPDEHVHVLNGELPWYADIVNYLVTKELPNDLSRAQKDRIKHDARYYLWDESYLFKICSDGIIMKCVPEYEIKSILEFCHVFECGGHFGPKITTHKVLEYGFFGPLCKEMLTCLLSLVINVKEPETFLREIKCPLDPSLCLKFFIFGESISWDPFPLLLVMFIFY